MPHIAIQLSCYNGARYLPHVLASLMKQTFMDWTLYVTDNASSSEEAARVRAAATLFGNKAVYVDVGSTNIDFVGAHNLLFSKHQAPYVLLHNDDAILAPDYLAKLVAALDADVKLGAVSGQIFRWNFERVKEADGGKTDTVDSAGLEKRRTWEVVDRASPPFQGGERGGCATSVFGVSGCLPLYRRQAILDASPDGHLFDPAFVSYKEDVDMAFRLSEADFYAAVVRDARAWHCRTFSNGSRDLQSERVLLHSYRNHLWNLLVHVRREDLLRDGWAFVPYEAAKAAYYLARRPSILVRAWKETWRRRAGLIEKRRFCQALKHAETRDPSAAPSSGSAPLKMAQAPMPTHYDISVIIVSHDDLNAACLASVDRARKASGLKVGVVIVDNASAAYDAAKLAWKVLPDAAIVQRNWDAGYGGSVNIGARQLDADYLFILNPDTELGDEMLFGKLIAFMQAHPQAGIAAPKIIYPDGRLQETVRRFPDWQVPVLQRTKLGETPYGKKYLHRFLLRDIPHDHARMVDWAQGSALFLPMGHWKELGGFDDRFWMYFEDVDLCRRSWEAHRPVYYVADAVLQHAYGKASKRQGNLLHTLLTNEMARAHSVSFVKYLWKWRRSSEGSFASGRDAALRSE